MSTQEEFPIIVPHQGVEQVKARLDLPDSAEPRAVFVMAHGAGTAMTSAFLEASAGAIAEAAAVAVLRFNYAYSEKMSRTGTRIPPEGRRALLVVHRAIHAWARDRFQGLPLVAGGKSMGGRMASLLAADGEEMTALAFLGYPLHAAGKPDKLRTDHFPDISVPTLFLQGTRDALCDLAQLGAALPAVKGGAKLVTIEGGDHSFSVLKRSGRTPHEVIDEISTALARWLDGIITPT